MEKKIKRNKVVKLRKGKEKMRGANKWETSQIGKSKKREAKKRTRTNNKGEGKVRK